VPRRFDAVYRESAVLRDGTRVTLRLVRPEDAPLFVRGFERLSPESRYRRFFTDKARLTADELAYLCDVDQERHFAIGAVRAGPDGEDEGAGVGRFVVDQDDPDVAEPAVVVLDDLQGKGLGRLLFLRLVAAARERGVSFFRSEVLADNDTMRGMIHEIAPDASEWREGQVVVVKHALPPIEADQHPGQEGRLGPLYRLLALAAERLVSVRQALVERLRELEAPRSDPPSRP
jgi:GNAT superfamily N-acetyltransferase